MTAGRTPLVRIEEFAGSPLESEVWLKDESANPFHTHKDRRSALIVQKALTYDIDTIALITAGNGGYSLAKSAEGSGLRIVLIVSENIRPSIKSILQATSATIIEVDLSKKLEPHDIVSLARHNEGERVWDVSNGYEEAYEGILYEIAGQKPEAIIAPVGSGELLLGIHRGIQNYGLQTKLYGVGVQSPHSKADKLYASYVPASDRIEKLVREGHEIAQLPEEEVEWAAANAPKEFAAEPSAQVIFAALQRVRKIVGKTVLINTGRGLQ